MPTDTQEPAAAQKLLQLLNEAHATEHALSRTLEAHIAITPRGSYRSGLEKHLKETRDHADRLERRMGELGASRNVIQMGIGVVESLIGQALALSKGPLDLVRGSGGEETLRFFAVYAAADVISRYEEEVQPGGSRERRPVA